MHLGGLLLGCVWPAMCALCYAVLLVCSLQLRGAPLFPPHQDALCCNCFVVGSVVVRVGVLNVPDGYGDLLKSESCILVNICAWL